MGWLEDRLASWAAAGLITGEQVAAIQMYEGRQRAPEPTEPRRSVTTPAEAVGYVGAALASGAIGLILTDLWSQLLVGGRLALVALLAAALFGGGLGLQRSGAPAMRRLMSVLFTAGIASTGWLAAILAGDVFEITSPMVAVIVGVVMLVVAVPLYLWKRRALLQLAMLGSALIAPVAALDLAPISPGPGWYGLVVGGIGAVWFVLALGNWLAPRIVGEVAGTIIAFIGVQIGAIGEARLVALVIGVLAAAALVALAVRSDRLHHLVLGAVALFVFSPQLVFELFGDAIGAPATLLLVGLLLVLLAVGLGRARREVVQAGPSATEETP